MITDADANCTKKVREYSQEITQSHTAYQPTAPCGRDTKHQDDNKNKATSSLYPFKILAKLERTLSTA